MFASTFVFAVLAGASAVTAGPVNATRAIKFNCGSTPSKAQISSMESNFASNRVSRKAGAKLAAATLNVYWHVIRAGNTTALGDMPDEQIEASIDVLNADYAESGVSFVLVNTTKTDNSSWFESASLYPDGIEFQTEMKDLLRQGSAADLNVYSVGFSKGDGQGLLGYATFPSDFATAPEDDGVVIHAGSVPGGDLSPYNEGRTLTHEAGHWFGLFHTFDQEGDCNGEGDLVEDTPAEAEPAFGCPTGRDSCTALEGVDPITNYMDYSDDSCMNQFSNGQVVRLQDQLRTFRNVTI